MVRESIQIRVLVVEDEPTVARAVKRALQRHGFHVDAASSHADSLRQFEPYDCGVFDINLPDSDGVELASRLLHRGLVRNAVFFSALDGPRIEQRARQHGFFVHKADGLTALQRAIATAVGQGRALTV